MTNEGRTLNKRKPEGNNLIYLVHDFSKNKTHFWKVKAISDIIYCHIIKKDMHTYYFHGGNSLLFLLLCIRSSFLSVHIWNKSILGEIS